MRAGVADIGKPINRLPKAISLIDTISDIAYLGNTEGETAMGIKEARLRLRRARGISRPRYIAPGDTRSPMLRLLQDCWSEVRGTVEVEYAQQFPTFFKARRLGYVDDRSRLTESGRQFAAGDV